LLLFITNHKFFDSAKLAVICCLECQQAKMSFQSAVVHEDIDALTKKDRLLLTNTADKQFSALEKFEEVAFDWFERVKG
jgi:hypothetical protein